MNAWALAWRTVAHNPARAVLAVSGVAVIGALLFNMLLLSRGLLVSFRDLLETAGYDVRVVAAEGSMVHREPIAEATALADAIGQLPAVQRVALVRTDSAVVTAPGRQTRGFTVTLVGGTENAIEGVWSIVKGSSLPLVSHTGDALPLRRRHRALHVRILGRIHGGHHDGRIRRRSRRGRR